MDDEPQLIEAARGGDAAAFGQLVQAYQDRLFNTMLHIVVCHAEAEDVVQDAFVRAYLKLSSFRSGSTFYTWLYRIAFNCAMSRRRRRKSELAARQSADGLRQELDPGGGPEARLVEQERASQVRTALDSLSHEHRAVLVLREIEGCDYETIGTILALPPGTVRSRIHRARMELREQLRTMLHSIK